MTNESNTRPGSIGDVLNGTNYLLKYKKPHQITGLCIANVFPLVLFSFV